MTVGGGNSSFGGISPSSFGWVVLLVHQQVFGLKFNLATRWMVATQCQFQADKQVGVHQERAKHAKSITQLMTRCDNL